MEFGPLQAPKLEASDPGHDASLPNPAPRAGHRIIRRRLGHHQGTPDPYARPDRRWISRQHPVSSAGDHVETPHRRQREMRNRPGIEGIQTRYCILWRFGSHG